MKTSTAFILLLISVGLFYTFTMPRWDKIGDLQAQAATYKNVLDNVTVVEAKRDELYAQYKNISPEQLAQIEKVLPNTVDTVTLALNLDAIAAHYGISIKSVQTSTNDPNDIQSSVIIDPAAAPAFPYQTVYVNFEIVSNYDNFRKFLGDIEKSLRIIDIKSIAFQATGDNKLYNYHISVQTYWTK